VRLKNGEIYKMIKTDYTIKKVEDNFIAYKDEKLASQINNIFGTEEVLHSIFILEGATANHFYHLQGEDVFLEIKE
jgi:hypothetical protein